MSVPMHDCPGGCGLSVPLDKLACPTCWYQLPDAQRREINAAYRARSRDPRRHRTAILAAFAWYREQQQHREDA